MFRFALYSLLGTLLATAPVRSVLAQQEPVTVFAAASLQERSASSLASRTALRYILLCFVGCACKTD